MFYLAGVGLAFFLSLLLLTKNNKTAADKILTCWLSLVTAHLLLFYFHKMWLYPQLLGVSIPFPLAHGPFLFIYTRALTNRALSRPAMMFHALPFVASFIYLIHFFALPLEQRIYVFKTDGVGYEIFNRISFASIIASGIVYVTLSSIALRKHRNAIANQFSSVEKINLQWLQYLIYWIGVIWLLVIFTNDDWVFAAAVLFILFIGFFGIRQAGIFHSHEIISPSLDADIRDILEPEKATEDSPSRPEEEKRKYQKSGLSADHAEMLHHQLTQLMITEKLFRESELSLTQLAERLHTPPNYLSQVINEREGKNFYDYVNTLRIEEFKRVASGPDSKKYTLLALAQHCGFNSKSSFNRYFKKVTGQSPSEFMLTVVGSEK